MKAIELEVNGRKHRVDTGTGRMLLNVLREDLDLTAAKYGCGEGQCGACTVLIDGSPVRSCLTPAGSLAGKKITTLEGLEKDGRLHPVQQAFLDEVAMQCGYCIPGMIMSGVGLLNGKSKPTRTEILAAMEGNICRCGSHPRIISALDRAASSKGGAK